MRKDRVFVPDAEVGKLTHRELAVFKEAGEQWRMTRDAYVQQVMRTSLGWSKRANGPIAKQLHFLVVRDAVSEGRPVPAQVLRDYPDLARERRKRKSAARLSR